MRVRSSQFTVQRFLGFSALLCLISGLPLFAQTLQISGDPLLISADEYGTIGVVYAGIPQYYATSSKGSVLFLDETNATARWGNGTGTFALWDNMATDRFTPVSHAQPDPWTIQTVFGAGGSGVQVQQTITYTDGNPFYTIAWQISGTSQNPFADVRFKHGGDVSPDGEDMAQGFWAAGSNMVYVLTTNTPPFFMGLQGNSSTPADHHYEAHFQLVRDACKAGDLPDTAHATLHDAAYALEWNRALLGSGDTWNITAHEWWAGVPTTPGFTDVTAQASSPLFDWELRQQTGTFFGNLTISNNNGMLSAPFWCAIDQNDDRRFMQPTGIMPDGHEYIDLTADVTALTGSQLSQGESVTITNIEVYMRYRVAPTESAFSIWATTILPSPE